MRCRFADQFGSVVRFTPLVDDGDTAIVVGLMQQFRDTLVIEYLLASTGDLIKLAAHITRVRQRLLYIAIDIDVGIYITRCTRGSAPLARIEDE